VAEASLAAAEAEAAPGGADQRTQRELRGDGRRAWDSAVEQVSAAFAEIFSLASRFGSFERATGATQIGANGKVWRR